MNKKKIAALALSGTLLMGAAGFGAYSWFTSSATVTPNLVVETGTLRVTAKDGSDSVTNGWVLQNTGSDLGDKETEANANTKPTADHDPIFNTVRPGDSFTKKVVIKNNGTLKERLNFDFNKDILDNYKDIVGVTAKQVIDEKGNKVDKTLNDLNGMVLEPLKSITVEIDASILTSTPGETVNGIPTGTPNYQGKSIDLSTMLKDGKLLTVNGEQVNEHSATAPAQN